MAITKLPAADRIQGLSYHPAPDPKSAHFEVQYQTRTGELYEIHIPAMDALYLMNLIEAAAKDAGIEHLRRPPNER